MKIVINAPMARDKIVNLLSGYKVNGVEFKFIKSQGIKLEFEVINMDGQSAVTLAKNLIRETDYGKVLYFSVDLL